MASGRLGAGRLDRRLQFQSPYEIEDGAGNTAQGWQPEFTVAANRKWLRGGESVMASRLEAKQPVIITIRNHIDARRISNDWRCVDSRDGRIYQIKELPKESEQRGYLEFLAESGVAG